MVTEGSCPGTEGGLVWSRPAAGIWRLSSGQLRTHCLAGKLPRRRASLRVTCCGCVPWDLEWGDLECVPWDLESPGPNFWTTHRVFSI